MWQEWKLGDWVIPMVFVGYAKNHSHNDPCICKITESCDIIWFHFMHQDDITADMAMLPEVHKNV